MKKSFFVTLTFLIFLGTFIGFAVSPQFKSFAASTSGDASTKENKEDNQTNNSSYEKILMKKEILNYPENNKINLTNVDNGLKISSDSESLKNTKFSFKDNFNFDKNTVSRLCLYAVSEKDSKLSIDFYLDNSDKPFTSVSVKNQEESNDFSKLFDISNDIYNLKLTGKHNISFKINQSDKKEKVNLLLASVEFVESSIPVVYFDIDETKTSIKDMNSDELHNTKCTGDMTIQIPDGYKGEYTKDALKTATYSLDYIKGRGNSTWTYGNRKPYKLKLKGNADLFGMGSNKHWVLLANDFDNSLLRNKVTYWLGEELGMKYTPQSVFVDVVMNGEYYGNYMLCEQVRVDENRIEIDNLEKTPDATDKDTISGGYLLANGDWGADGKAFKTEHGNSFCIESPDFTEKVNEAQFDYIKNYVQQVEDAIYGENFKNSDGKHYSELIDMDSLIDYFWIQTFSQNGDAFATGSTYLYKERGGKLFFGPLWDFDLVAWGNANPEYIDYYDIANSWLPQLLKDPEFNEKVKQRWSTIKEKLALIYKDNGVIDNYDKQISISQKYTFEKFEVDEKAILEERTKFEEFKKNLMSFEKRCFSSNPLDSDKEFITEFKNNLKDSYKSENLSLDQTDKDFFNDLDPKKDNITVQSILNTYRGNISHEKTVIFLKVWIKSRINWISDNLSKLDDIQHVSYYDECTVKAKFEDSKEEISLMANADNDYTITLPNPPEKKGYTFLGWFEEFEGKEYRLPISKDNKVEIYYDMTLTGRYIKTKDIKPVKKIEFTYSKVLAPFSVARGFGRTNIFNNVILYPEDATFVYEDNLEYKSSDTSIATTTYDGWVEFSKPGTVTITVTHPESGVSANCTVTADENYKLQHIKATKKDITLKQGEIIPMPIETEPANMCPYLNWLSTDESIAWVDQKNRLHTKNEGTVEIRAYNYDIYEYVSFNVTVTKDKSNKNDLVQTKKDKINQIKVEINKQVQPVKEKVIIIVNNIVDKLKDIF